MRPTDLPPFGVKCRGSVAAAVEVKLNKRSRAFLCSTSSDHGDFLGRFVYKNKPVVVSVTRQLYLKNPSAGGLEVSTTWVDTNLSLEEAPMPRPPRRLPKTTTV